MAEHKLDCCVVRDLLPAFVEELTEAETAGQVAEHLEHCPECRAVERDMRAQVPVEQAPKRALRFLRRVRRTRLLAAALTVILTLWCAWWLYDTEFHYPNTESGRLAAVGDYIPSPSDSTMNHGVKEGETLRVIAWAERENRLFIFYGTENEDNVHGILHLVRGINGKYRPVNASMDPFPYTAGVYAERLWVQDVKRDPFVLAGENCREIYAAAVEYVWIEAGNEEYQRKEVVYELSEMNFLYLLEQEEIERALGLENKELFDLSVYGVRLMDREGNDITQQYQDKSVSQWSTSRATVEVELLYVYIAVVTLMAVILVRYFLRKD